jgi:sensor c-di-GMP phosphodiesterase-like protein
MSRVIRRQTLSARLLTVAFILGGCAAGYFLGRQAVIWESVSKLDQYSKAAVAQNDASLKDARQVLESMKVSSASTCTDDDVEYLRGLVFRTANLKDAGRIQHSIIRCSANSGRTARAITSLDFDSSSTNDGLTYYHLKSTGKADPYRAALQLGSVYVVFNSGEPFNQDSNFVGITVTTKSGTLGQTESNTGPPPANDFPEGALEGSGQLGKSLFATRCSSLGFNCITLSVPTTYVMQKGNLAIATLAAVGAVAGLLLCTLLLNVHTRSHDLPNQLKRALDREQLEVVYQPIVNLATQTIIGAEALARWNNEDGEPVKPDIFVKIAEEKGFIGKITKLVLHRVLRDFAATLRSRPGFRISMNVSAVDLSDPAFLPMMDEALKKANVKPQSIVIEITERSATDGIEAREAIRNLRRKGFAIHIDDFGTGHSNLDKLLYLYADTIKIDRAFTQVIGTDSVTAVILPQILAMARTLGLGVVVEGVETKAQSDYFNPGEQKIHAQGWLYGRPGTADALKSSLAAEPPVPIPIKPEIAKEPPIEVPEVETSLGKFRLVKSHIA